MSITHEPSEISRSAELPPRAIQRSWTQFKDRWKRIITLAVTFLFGQAALQGINVLVGLYLVRALSVEHYAQFGLAFGFQTTVCMLMDLGFTSTIIPMVGERTNDRALVGSYLRAAKHLRDRTFWILSPFATIVFLWMMHKHTWGWATQAILLLSVLLATYSSGPVAYYSAPLFLFRRLREYYFPQTISGLTRMLAYLGLAVAGGLSGAIAAALSSINVLANAILLRRSGGRCVEWPKTNEPEVNREVLRYILPAIPTFIFAAFQSQIALFLINAFGQTVNVAEVAALSRLAQLFTVLMYFNLVIVEPRLARLSRERLLGAYLRMLLLPCGIGLSIVPLAFVYPRAFIWLIGPHYRSLAPLAGWVVLTGCLNYAANLIWIMNRSRKWIFWRGTIIEIAVMFLFDVCFVALVGVRSTKQAILFTLTSSVSAVCTHSYIGVYGFLRGGADLSESRSEFPEPITSRE
jgi:O-antigen/teichoic acid export membrane protein